MINSKLLLKFKRLIARISLPTSPTNCWRPKIGDAIVLHPRKVGGRRGVRVLMRVMVGLGDMLLLLLLRWWRLLLLLVMVLMAMVAIY